MKLFSIIFLMLSFALSSLNLYSQNNTAQFVIDTQLQQCLDSNQNQTTAGMIGCTIKARDAWDKELNKNYKLLMQALSADEKVKLKTAQKNWLIFRDSELAFTSTMYNNMDGTMWSVAKVQADADLIKQRALALQAYYEDKQPK